VVDYKIDISCFSAEHEALRSRTKTGIMCPSVYPRSVVSALLGSGCGAALPNINVYRKFQMAIKGANTIDTTPPQKLAKVSLFYLYL
jgi:hypothetical protein